MQSHRRKPLATASHIKQVKMPQIHVVPISSVHRTPRKPYRAQGQGSAMPTARQLYFQPGSAAMLISAIAQGKRGFMIQRRSNPMDRHQPSGS